MCDNYKRIGLALEMSADLPSADVMERWYGEPVKCCILPTSIFLSNRKGFPVLARAHQQVVQRLFKVRRQPYVQLCQKRSTPSYGFHGL